jgi:hypothetical protein
MLQGFFMGIAAMFLPNLMSQFPVPFLLQKDPYFVGSEWEGGAKP